MADKDLEKRLAALEKSSKAAEARAAAAERLVEAKERELKAIKAHSRDRLVELKAENHKLNSMRDLSGPDSPFANDSRETYDALKKATVKTKDGRRHYYLELPAYVGDHGKPPYVYYPAESVVSIPADQDPSVTWKPVKVGGKDPKTGALIMVPLESQLEAPGEEDLRQQVEEGTVETLTNTELNEKGAAKRVAAAQRGGGAPAKPTPPQAPGANETEGAEGEGQRPSDTEVG